jgi:hypothetical protein
MQIDAAVTVTSAIDFTHEEVESRAPNCQGCRRRARRLKRAYEGADDLRKDE